MADERRRRGRAPVIVATLAYPLLAAEAVAGGWSLVSSDPWDWDRFWSFFVVVLMSAVASAVAAALTRGAGRGARRAAAQDDETSRAVRTGLLPPAADPEEWRSRIRGRGRQAAQLGTSCTFLSLAAAVLTASAAHVTNDDDPVLLTLAVAALLLLAPLYWVLVRDRRRRQRLLARL